MKYRTVKFSKIITEEIIREFSSLTKDFHKVHSSLTFAKKKGFKNIIAHGFLISSICSLTVYKLMGNTHFIVSQKFEYNKPIFLGEKINIKGVCKVKSKVLKLKEIEIIVKNKKNIKCKGFILIKKL